MGSTPIFGMDVTGVEPGLILWQWECALKKAADRQDPFTEHVPAHTKRMHCICASYKSSVCRDSSLVSIKHSSAQRKKNRAL